jgi:hypothetical protein
MRKILLVAVVLSLFVFPASAGAQDAAPLWHCDAVTVAQASPGWNVTATGAGAYWRIKAVGGATVAGPQQSPVFANVALVEGTQYQAQAADSAGGPWSNNPGCLFTVTPLAVVIEEFSAACISDGVRLAWGVNTEAFSTRYTVARDGDVVLTVPADCPGCTAGASYSRDVVLPDPHGVYTLQVWNGDGLIDVEETWLETCPPPTAVHLSRFAAYGHRHPFNGWRVMRVEIMTRAD